MKRINLQLILQSTQGTPHHFDSLEVSFPEISIDSREISAGGLFWALKGEKQDGHHYLDEAARKGAAALVVQLEQAENAPLPCIAVPDTYQALVAFATAYRKTLETLLIGVTGSVGKTTTREMIYSTLRTGFNGFRSPKNFNNEFGVPFSLLSINPTDEFAVLELGAARANDLNFLLDMVHPEMGVVTEVSPAHLSTFGQLENILNEKQKLIAALPDSGFAVLNGDSPKVRLMAEIARCPVVHVGFNENNELRAVNVQTENGKIWFEAGGDDYFLPAMGEHHIRAALAAIAIGKELGLSLAQLRDGIADFQPMAGRCQWNQIGQVILIDDTYNASPASMKAAIETLEALHVTGKRILIVGDMLELGPGEIFFHHQLGEAVAHSEVEMLISFGDFASAVIAGARQYGMPPHQTAVCSNFDSLLAVLSCTVEHGDAILVKGSRGMQMERITQWLAEHLEADQDNYGFQFYRPAA
ncbi:MAG: UDP-N-acetylmuramoyl-tripeptide--D-alanyl-D-alanine ligase [Planctomycetaceae bacterium]